MPDIYSITFFILATLTIVAALAIFIFRRLLHSILALTAVFAASALIFLLLGQTMIALLQLLIFVGGLSTYLMVAIAAEERASFISLRKFIPVAIAFSIALLLFASKTIGSGSITGNSITSTFAAAFQQYFLLLYVMILLLFGTAIGSVLFIKKFTKLVI